MATFSKVVLSGGTSGADILVAATATAGTLIHTANATALDEIWLWAQNNTTADVVLFCAHADQRRRICGADVGNGSIWR